MSMEQTAPKAKIANKKLLTNATEKKLNLYFMPRDTQGSGFYRMLLPASIIKDNNLANVEINPNLNQKLTEWADVIIVQRAADTDFYEFFEYAQAQGKIIIYEIDDLLYGIQTNNPGYTSWAPQHPRLARALRLMSMANHITVTTDRLANEYYNYNKNIFVLPNYLDAALWDTPKGWTASDWDDYYIKKNDDTVRIGWMGGASHRNDLEMIAPVLTSLAKKHKNVKIIIMGYDAHDIFAKIPLAQAVCPHCCKEGQLQIEPGVGILDYPAKLKSLALDIGIAPLFEIAFSECKSDLKLKEFAALGIPVVASNIKPYSKSLQNGLTGYLAEDGKEWFNYLELLVKSKNTREELGRNARLWYEKNTIDKHIHKWIKAYEQAVNRLPQW